jgi:hypothetical protein
VNVPRGGRRQLLVLTPEEKKTVAFVLVALFLGIATKQYREAHAIPPRKTAIVEVAKTVGLPAQKRAEAKRRKKAE